MPSYVCQYPAWSQGGLAVVRAKPTWPLFKSAKHASSLPVTTVLTRLGKVPSLWSYLGQVI